MKVESVTTLGILVIFWESVIFITEGTICCDKVWKVFEVTGGEKIFLLREWSEMLH